VGETGGGGEGIFQLAAQEITALFGSDWSAGGRAGSKGFCTGRLRGSPIGNWLELCSSWKKRGGRSIGRKGRFGVSWRWLKSFEQKSREPMS